MSVSSVNKINSVNATQEVFKIEDVSKTANSQAIKLNNDVNNENMSDENQQAAGANAVNATTEKLREISNALVGFNKSLVIEKDPETSGYIYKTIDKSTGDVIKVWPQALFLDKLSSLQDVDARGIIMNKLV